MMVRVRLYGTLRRFSSPETPGLWTGEVPSRSTVADVLAVIGIDPREVAGASIRGELVRLDAKVPEDAELVLVTPIGGG